jgi:CsoR family transcriptional regulator, copper-sensing transcriptional repressor
MTIQAPSRTPATTPTRPRHRHDQVSNRLRRGAGQLGGVLTMYEDSRRPTEILDQIAATRAALDAVALLILDEYTAACTQRAAVSDDTDRVMTDLTATVRRYIRSR